MGKSPTPISADELVKLKEAALNQQKINEELEQQQEIAKREEEDNILRTGARDDVSLQLETVHDLLASAAARGEDFCQLDVGETSASPYSVRPKKTLIPDSDDAYAEQAKALIASYCQEQGIIWTCEGYVWSHGHEFCNDEKTCQFGCYRLRFRISFANVVAEKAREVADQERQNERERRTREKAQQLRKDLPATAVGAMIWYGFVGAVVGIVLKISQFRITWAEGILWGIAVGIVFGFVNAIAQYKNKAK